MSAEFNKILCAALSAILVYLLASFTEELIYHQEKIVSLSYSIENEKVIKPKITDEKLSTITIDNEKIKNLLKSANLEDGEKFVKKNCASCHDFNLPAKNKIGPSLAIVFGRKIASLENYKYSKALKSKTDEWNLLNLYLFLEKPKEWAEGTKMSYKGIKDQIKLLNAIKYLETISIANAN